MNRSHPQPKQLPASNWAGCEVNQVWAQRCENRHFPNIPLYAGQSRRYAEVIVRNQTADRDSHMVETDNSEDRKSQDSAIQAGDVVQPDDSLPSVTLAELPAGIQAAAARANWNELLPVQAQTLPYILAGRDLMVQSRTGSGKTGAFLLPILDRIDPTDPQCQCLILVPTRELCQQVHREAEMLSAGTEIRTVAVYGGVRYDGQMRAFREGAHLVVGTPGRVLDHLLRRTLKLQKLKTLVFDEADRMLSMGFYPDMIKVKTFLPKHRINGYMFSATFPPYVLRLARQFLHTPEVLSLSRDHVHVTDTEHVYYFIPGGNKDRALVRIIEIENPTAAIIFCNTKSKVHYVSVVLQRFGYDADELTSDLGQNARDQVLTRIRKGQLRFLVATDVAARGIDIPDLSHVIQFEVPEDAESYIHRAGRTGRVGASGEAITLVSGMERIELSRIAKRYNIEMEERPLPSDEDVATIVSERITAMLEAHVRNIDKLQAERMQRFTSLARELGENDDELAVIAMLLDEFYQERLHAPPVPPTETIAPPEQTATKPSRKRRRPRGRK